MPEKVLIITYYWPPSGGAGVQRWLKFTKYLPASGWLPVVLTVNPENAAYPVKDTSLYGDIPLDVEVHRTRATNYFSLYSKDQSKIPSAGFASESNKGIKSAISRFLRGNFFIPDPRKGWNKYAFRKACELIKTENIGHVITTSPPHSTQLIGLKLKHKFPQIRWVADLRDPWTDIYYYEMFHPTFLAKMVDRAMEKSVLKRADGILTVGNSLASLFADKVPDIEDKIHVIPNGFDEEDFEGIASTQPDALTITYVGTLSEVYPVDGFLKAIKGLNAGEKPVHLRFVGSIQESVRAMIIAETEGCISEFIPYSDHPVAIKHMMSSSLLLMIIPDHPSGKSIITGKLFEYMASGKPVLFIGPVDGDAAHLLARCGYQGIFGYDNQDGIRNFILKIASGRTIVRADFHAEYSRRALTNNLSNFIYGNTH
ncbi:MAG TPA: glycosyltransferase family 4 protein [Bacteroidales bacterium]|nr:glycosyltransferase family 4 protein [Bacteroidales bacterium]